MKKPQLNEASFKINNSSFCSQNKDTIFLKKATPQTSNLKLENLRKRAKSKYITNGMILALVDLKSDLGKSYWNTYHCNESLLQNGKKITSKFCNNRFCSTCNRVRTMKLLNGYESPLNSLKDKYFVTLTVPNVKGAELKTTIDKILAEFRLIQKTFEKRKTPIIGIRKLECTYNPKSDSFHPHLHILISGKSVASNVLIEWLKRFPEVNKNAQDMRMADNNAVEEVFKYFAKMVTGKGKNRKIYIASLDIIFLSMRNRRVFQPMGIKKYISEEIEELQSKEYDIPEANRTLFWDNPSHDWVDPITGEVLTGYIPGEKEKKLLNNII
jgi:hypothetical protein